MRPQRRARAGAAAPGASGPASTKRPTTSTRGTYVFCVLASDSVPRLRKHPPKIPGAGPARLLELEPRTWLVVADVPLEHFGQKPLVRGLQDLEWVSRCALAHDAVIARFATLGSVVPMKLFTIFSSDERARAHVEAMGKRLHKLLSRVKGRAEWGVRVWLDRGKARQRALASARDKTPSSGKGFLALKRRQRTLAGRLSADARGSAERVFQRLSRGAAEAQRRELTPEEAGQGVLLDAAFLIPLELVNKFKQLVLRQAADTRDDGLKLALSGPWPPYTFVAEKRRGAPRT